MPGKLYVDTNVVVDICDAKRPNYIKSFAFIEERLKKENGELFINSDTLSVLFYILSNRSTLSQEQVLEKMNFVSDIFTLVTIESTDVEQALKLCSDKTTAFQDYEDALQYVCARKINADAIVTNDKGFASEEIEILRTCS